MGYGKTSWIQLKYYTKTGCHKDWIMGSTNHWGTRDFLQPNKVIPTMDTVLWNRTYKKTTSLATYQEVQRTRNPEQVKLCEEYGLPMDIHLT